MDCQALRADVERFADGELDPARNEQVYEHLRVCTSCSALVERTSELKRELARVLAKAQIPSGLGERVCESIQRERTVGWPVRKYATNDERTEAPSIVTAPSAWDAPVFDEPEQDGPVFPGPSYSCPVRDDGRSWRPDRRVAVPIAFAACVAILVIGWQVFSIREHPRGTITVVAGRVISEMRYQHDICRTRRAWDHYGSWLPRNPQLAAAELSQSMGLKVIVPDLVSHGYAYNGVDRCGIAGRDAAHALYTSTSTSSALSVFTTARQLSLGSEELARTGDRAFFVSEEDGISVVAWHEGPQSYFFCGSAPKDEIIAMAADVRTAWLTPEPGSTGVVLALATGRKFSYFAMRSISDTIPPVAFGSGNMRSEIRRLIR